jgi:hypothetical protein
MKTFNLTKRNEKGAEIIIASCFNQKKKKGGVDNK